MNEKLYWLGINVFAAVLLYVKIEVYWCGCFVKWGHLKVILMDYKLWLAGLGHEEMYIILNDKEEIEYWLNKEGMKEGIYWKRNN